MSLGKMRFTKCHGSALKIVVSLYVIVHCIHVYVLSTCITFLCGECITFWCRGTQSKLSCVEGVLHSGVEGHKVNYLLQLIVTSSLNNVLINK